MEDQEYQDIARERDRQKREAYFLVSRRSAGHRLRALVNVNEEAINNGDNDVIVKTIAEALTGKQGEDLTMSSILYLADLLAGDWDTLMTDERAREVVRVSRAQENADRLIAKGLGAQEKIDKLKLRIFHLAPDDAYALGNLKYDVLAGDFDV